MLRRIIILLPVILVYMAGVAGEGTGAVEQTATTTDVVSTTEAATSAASTVAVTTANAVSTTAQTETKARNIESRIYRLNHCSAAEVAAKFNEMWNGEFGQTWKVTKMAVSFPESNSVMLSAPRPILDACEKAIAELDVEAQQVYIEARFVDLKNNASHKLGFNWQMLDSMGGSARLGGGIQHSHIGSAVQNYDRTIYDGNNITTYNLGSATGHDGQITYFNGTLDFTEMSIILHALESAEDAKIFSNPKIIVSSGKMAVVDMTTKYPNVKISAKRTTTGGGADSLDLDMQMASIPGEDKFMFANESFFSWGISLEVTPRVGTNGLINVSIVPTISDKIDFVTAGTTDSNTDTGSYSAKYPVIEVQRLVTEFNLASETTAVIGGLSKTEERQVDNGIPVLRSIPWIGPWIFGSKTRVKEQHEILVFVTVGLVDPNKMPKDAGLPKNAVLGRQYVQEQRYEPGDKPNWNAEGIESLDLRPLDEQARDPQSTNVVDGVSFMRHIPFFNNKETIDL